MSNMKRQLSDILTESGKRNTVDGGDDDGRAYECKALEQVENRDEEHEHRA
jgi:hypothetical protein